MHKDRSARTKQLIVNGVSYWAAWFDDDEDPPITNCATEEEAISKLLYRELSKPD